MEVFTHDVKCPSQRTALLFTTHRITQRIIDNFSRIVTPNGWEKILFLDATGEDQKERPSIFPDGLRVERFAFDSHVMKPGYSPVAPSLVPGSSHFPFLQFLIGSDFDRAWQIEYDVVFTGNWIEFFRAHEASAADFLSAHIRRKPSEPDWYWWQSLKTPVELEDCECLKSFNPIYRLSRMAALALHDMFRHGWSGHQEATIATCIHYSGLKLEDLGGDGEFTQSRNRGKWYSHLSHAWLRNFSSVGDLGSNMIAHPCKEEA